MSSLVEHPVHRPLLGRIWSLERSWPTLGWGLPFLFAAVYAILILTRIGTIVNHTWWSADSASAGVIGALYRLPPAGHYVIIGDHGWFEAAAFYILTRFLPAHRAIAYVAPVALWAVSIALVGRSSARAFGRYGAALVVAALVCVAPTGLMVIFQPTAHTNVLFHAALLAAISGWVLPRVRQLALWRLCTIAVVLGAFTGLAAAADAIALVWAALPFAVACGVCAWRGSPSASGRTLLFGLLTLGALFLAAAIFGAIMHGLRIEVDEFALKRTLSFAAPARIAMNAGMLVRDWTYLIGGDFFGREANFIGVVDLITGLLLFAAAGAVAFATRQAVSGAGSRAEAVPTGSASARTVHISFWFTVLVAGCLMFLLGTPGTSNVSRYLLGPLVAVAALLPLAAARGLGWRLCVAAGVSALALAGVIRMLNYSRMPLLPATQPLAAGAVHRLERFADRYRAHTGYGAYYDAMTLTWYTGFRLRLYEVKQCDGFLDHYCPRYQASFTDAYTSRPGIRTLFIADPLVGFERPDPAWGRPLASARIDRLTAYVYRYDIAARFPRTPPGLVRGVIDGHLPTTIVGSGGAG